VSRRHGSQWKGGNGDGVMRRVVTSPHAHLVTGALSGLDRLLTMWATVLGPVISTPLVAGHDATRKQAWKERKSTRGSSDAFHQSDLCHG
jgi:hypothetical protein